MIRTAFGREFSGAAGFLNSAAYGLPPTDVAAAQRALLDDWEAGTLSPQGFDWSVAAARSAFASLTGTAPEDVAMAGAVSPLIGLVAAAVPDRARVGVLRGEFTSVSFPFAAHAARGVRVEEHDPAELIAAAAALDVVAVSTVQSADGAVLDLDALRRATAGTDTLVILDVTQAVGWRRTEAGWADLVTAGSYKWLLAPRGLAWAAISPRLQERLIPSGAGWYAGEEPWASVYGLPLRLASSARRFDVSPAWFSAHGAGLTLPWLASLDPARLEAHCLHLAGLARGALELEDNGSAILAIRRPDAPERLERAGIRAAVRAGAARVSFHLYNTEDDVERLVDALRA